MQLKERIDPMTPAQKGALALKAIAIDTLTEILAEIQNADPMKPEQWEDIEVIDHELDTIVWIIKKGEIEEHIANLKSLEIEYSAKHTGWEAEFMK
jgi:hypothetical protein